MTKHAIGHARAENKNEKRTDQEYVEKPLIPRLTAVKSDADA